MFAASLSHNATLQNTVLQAEAAYFTYMATVALLGAEQSAIAQARASLNAAQQRFKVGLATIADVLQAKTALSQELIPAKQEIVREFVAAEMRDIIGAAQALLAARVAGVKEQLRELGDLQYKNADVMHQMLLRVKTEKETFEKGLVQFAATRSVLARNTNSLFTASAALI